MISPHLFVCMSSHLKTDLVIESIINEKNENGKTIKYGNANVY